MKDRISNALNAPSEVWSSIFDSCHNGVVIIDRDGILVVYNEAARRIFAERRQFPVGRHFSEFRPETWPDMQEILAGGRAQIGRRIVLPEATIIANRSPIRVGGEVLGVISVFQDISEYEAIISGLQGYRKLHCELEAIFESSFDGFYITDGSANTVRVNSAYERITGLSRDKLIGRNMRDLVQEGVFDHSVTLEVIKRREPVTILQNIMGNKLVMVTGTPFREESGDIALVVTNVRDLTELNELRAQLEESRRLSSRYYQSLLEQDLYEHVLQDMVVKSDDMRQVVRKAIKVAGVDRSVLIHGESGVGKSMLARIIHQVSPRKDRPFVKINCGAIPDSLMETELFGYEKGAFTGAAPEGKAGLIEAGHSGTVFLDEVGELKPAMQVKLLGVIEDRKYTRVGGTRTVSVDVRIIAATNRDLKDMMRKGLFREDLYYRLNVIPIHIPPLRSRREDIPAFAMRILEKYNRTAGVNKKVAPEVLDCLSRCDFPGNVRELVNLMERMVIMSDGEMITLTDVPAELREANEGKASDAVRAGLTLKQAVEQTEAQIIAGALNHYETLAEAARSLDVHATTLWRKMVKYGFRSGLQNGNPIAVLQSRPKHTKETDSFRF